MKQGGFKTGGTNFDAKLRRQSINPDDLLIAHIGAMDVCARGLKTAVTMLKDGVLASKTNLRYAGWEDKIGKDIETGFHSLQSLHDLVLEKDIRPTPYSGQQELYEMIVNRYM